MEKTVLFGIGSSNTREGCIILNYFTALGVARGGELSQRAGRGPRIKALAGGPVKFDVSSRPIPKTSFARFLKVVFSAIHSSFLALVASADEAH